MPRKISHRWLHIAMLVVTSVTSAGVCDEPVAGTLIVVDGAAGLATFEQLKPNWSITVHVQDEQREFARSNYVLWGNYADQDRSAQILLADGTVLVGELVRIETESVTLASRLWGEIQIDRHVVRACLPLPAADPLERDRQWRRLQTPQTADRTLLLNGDTIAGRLLPTTEREDGGLFGLVAIGIELPGSAASTSVQIEEVRAITFQAPPERAMQTECLLGFRDGSLVAASKLMQVEPDRMQITTAAGASLALRTHAFRDNVTFIQPRGMTVDYLSDLPAVGYKAPPFLALDWPLGVATNTLGGRLRAGSNVISKGLGMHGASRVVYALDHKYRRFEAELALDDHSQRQGSVVYRVLVERENETGRRAWKLAFTSPIVRGGDTPLSIGLDVTDATRLALVVEMADRADTCDYANWLNARLLR